MNEYPNTQFLFNNCPTEVEVKEPIKALVLTDDECRKIKLGRAEMLKVVEPVQIEVKDFVVREKTRLLYEKADEAYKKVKDAKTKKKYYDPFGNEIAFLPTKSLVEIDRKVDKKCLEEYDFYPHEVLKSLTRASVLEDVYKIVMRYKNREERLPSRETDYQVKVDDILSGEDDSYNEFKYKGKLIFDTDDDDLPYTAEVEKKHDPRLYGRYLETNTRNAEILRKKKAGHQRPANTRDFDPRILRDPGEQFEGIYIPDPTIDKVQQWVKYVNTEEKRAYQKMRPEKLKTDMREKLGLKLGKQGISWGWWRQDATWS